MITEIITKQPASPKGTAYMNENLRRLSQKPNTLTVQGLYTFTNDDNVYTLRVDATANGITVTLPGPTGSTKRRIVKVDSSGHFVTVVPNAAGTLIDGQYDSVILTKQGTFVELEPNGTGWMVTSARYL